MRLIKPTGRALAERSKEAEDAERGHLEPRELAALWRVLGPDPFWNGYFRLQYHFGCRCSEVAILLKEDVDLSGKRIIIRRLKKRQSAENASGWKERPYDITPKLGAHLARVVPAVHKDNPWFFGSPHQARDGDRRERMANIRITEGGWRSVSRSGAQGHFQAAAKAAGIPAHLRHTHVLRHTRATLLFANGNTEATVQMLLDHSSVDITRNYIGWAASMKDKAAIALMLED